MSLESFESVVFVCPNVNVYQIPPRLTGKAFKTDSWGSLAQPIFSGKLRVVLVHQAGDNLGSCDIRIEDAQSGELFASAPYIGEHAAQRSEDSSRYWQLRVVHEKKVAYLGIGFEDSSFDFQVALSDYMKSLKAAKDASTKSIDGLKDYSIKDGESLSIHLGARGRKIAPGDRHGDFDSLDLVPTLAPPPPSAAKSRRTNPAAAIRDEDEFGEFQ